VAVGTFAGSINASAQDVRKGAGRADRHEIEIPKTSTACPTFAPGKVQTSSKPSFVSLLTKLAKSNDVTIAGDTDHTSGLVTMAIYNPTLIRAMGCAGVKHIVLEAGDRETQILADTVLKRIRRREPIDRVEFSMGMQMFNLFPNLLSPEDRAIYPDRLLDMLEAAAENGIAVHFRNYPPIKTLAFLDANPELKEINQHIYEAVRTGGIAAEVAYEATLTDAQSALRNEYLDILIVERKAINPLLADFINGLKGKVVLDYGIAHFLGDGNAMTFLQRKTALIALVGSDNATKFAETDGTPNYYVFDLRRDELLAPPHYPKNPADITNRASRVPTNQR
jgi:hypothetical protein